MPATINADNGVVSGSAGVKTTADTSGELALQSNGVTGLTLNTSLAIGVGSGNSTGASGQVLTSAGSGAAPTWATPATLPSTQQIFTFTPLTGTYSRAASVTGTYAQSATQITVTRTAHGFVAGNWVYLDFTTGTANDAWYAIISATTDTFTVTRATSATTSGNVTIHAPIVVTVTNHGLSNAGNVYVDYSGISIDGVYKVRSATTNTFLSVPNADGTGGAIVSNWGNYTTTPAGPATGTVLLPQVGNSSQTWTRPTGCKAISVELVGAAGSGNGSYDPGGGGGYSRKFIDVTAISSVAVTVGATGAPTLVSGFTTGGTTSFGAQCSATGGGFDPSGSPTPGAGAGGTLNLSGLCMPNASGGYSYLGTPQVSTGGCPSVTTSVASGYGTASGTLSIRHGVVFVQEYY